MSRNKVPMTITGAETIRQIIKKLKSIDRPQVINAIAEARAQGDLSENAEYDAARDRQAFLEGRIRELEGKISTAEIIDPKDMSHHEHCVFGATVEILDVETEETFTYQIVGEDEADIKLKKISISSPIARGLIGKYVGDIIEIQTPMGIKCYELMKISYF